MKQFTIKLPLHKFLDYGGVCKKGMKMMLIEHYFCKLIEVKFSGVFVVEMLDDSLYPKGKQYSASREELYVVLNIRDSNLIIVE